MTTISWQEVILQLGNGVLNTITLAYVIYLRNTINGGDGQ